MKLMIYWEHSTIHKVFMHFQFFSVPDYPPLNVNMTLTSPLTPVNICEHPLELTLYLQCARLWWNVVCRYSDSLGLHLDSFLLNFLNLHIRMRQRLSGVVHLVLLSKSFHVVPSLRFVNYSTLEEKVVNISLNPVWNIPFSIPKIVSENNLVKLKRL